MTEILTASEEPFLVKEMAWVNYGLSILFFVMFLFGILTLAGGMYVHLGDVRYLFLATLIPAIFLLGSAIHNKPFLEINQSGINYSGKLVCGWDNFVNADMVLEAKPGGLSDDMRLVVQYYDPEKGMQYVVKLKMKSLMDKSEDQIIEAIRSFLAKRNA